VARHELWLARDDGTRLALIDTVVSFAYSIVVHDVGVCSLVLPGSYDAELMQPDRRIDVLRDGVLQRVYLVRRRIDQVDRRGIRSLKVVAYDGNYLLGNPSKTSGRIVAYNAASPQADVSGPADDLLKEVIRDNLGADALTARQISTTYLTVQANSSSGPTITKAFSYRNVLAVLQDLVLEAREAGTDVYWDVAPVSQMAWEFRTSTGQPGRDHTYPGGNPPVHLSYEEGTLAEPVLDEDWTDEATFVYAGGQGEEDARIIETAEDTARSGRSIFGRRERFIDARQETSSDAVQAAAYQALSEGRPSSRFAARILDQPGCQYGLHWSWGDKVTAVYRGRSFDCVIRSVAVSVDSNGKETVSAALEVDS